MKLTISVFGRFFFACALLAIPFRAHAALGQPQPSAQYVQTTSGVTQYANAQGIVYAVRWASRTPVDLQALLGAYFPQVETAQQSNLRSGLNAPLAVATTDLVVHMFQTPGHWFGVAYVPSLVPAGVNPETLK